MNKFFFSISKLRKNKQERKIYNILYVIFIPQTKEVVYCPDSLQRGKSPDEFVLFKHSTWHFVPTVEFIHRSKIDTFEFIISGNALHRINS